VSAPSWPAVPTWGQAAPKAAPPLRDLPSADAPHAVEFIYDLYKDLPQMRAVAEKYEKHSDAPAAHARRGSSAAALTR
jgi:hypothetical protein